MYTIVLIGRIAALGTRGADAGSMPTNFSRMAEMARQTRDAYRVLEIARWGKEWSVQDHLVGFVGDVGDLAQLMGAREGIRPGPDDLDAAISHELADCLWSLLVLANEMDIDLEAAYLDLDTELHRRVEAKLAELPPSE